MMPSAGQFIEVQGGRVWCEVFGGRRRATPLLVLHGGPGATSDYLEPLRTLATERPVVLYDQLGGGRSDRPSDTSLWTIERFADELRRVRDFLGLNELHLLGQSWGAMLAVEYAARAGSAGIRSLVLSAPFLDSKAWIADARNDLQDLPPAMRAAIDAAEREGSFESEAYQTAMNEFYHRHLCRMDPWPECLTRTFAGMGVDVYHHMWGPSEFTVTGTLKTQDSTPLLADLAMPILYTAGRFDEAHPDTVRRFQSMGRNAELRIFEEASHAHHLEKEDEYLGVVSEFLQRVDGLTIP